MSLKLANVLHNQAKFWRRQAKLWAKQEKAWHTVALYCRQVQLQIHSEKRR